MKTKNGLSPIVNCNTKVLILGSFPGEKSLQKKEYYTNIRNKFWVMMSDLLNLDLSSKTYTDKIRILLQHQIGLWDIVKSCHRIGSSDAAMKNIKPNKINKRLQKYPNIKVIVINGLINYKLFTKYQKVTVTTKAMPSTSPRSRMSYKYKKKKWMQLLKYL